MPKTGRVLLLVLILLATGLRLHAFFTNHFHADEALFASWARLIAVWRDPLLLSQAVDKPPLLYYLQALAFPLFGHVEWAARLPNMAASILLVPLTAVLAWRLYRDSLPSLAAALIVTLSPLAIQFSATAFTDPLLTALVVAALALVAGPPKPFWAGLAFGLAILSKHQGWLFLPLLLGLAWAGFKARQQWRNLLFGFLPPFGLLLAWQIARSGRLDLLGNQMSNFGGLRLAWSWELLPRLAAWADLWVYVTGSAFLMLLFLVMLPVLWRLRPAASDRAVLYDRILILFVEGYVILHWLLAIPVWDRYLLPLVPLVAVLLGRVLARARDYALAEQEFQPGRLWVPTAVLLLFLALLQAPQAAAAYQARLPVGGQPGADEGAWQVARFLEEAPYGTVLYDHWYSWHWRYAFLDKGVYVSWFPHPQSLARDLAVFGASPGDRYLVLPDNDQAIPVLRAVNESGFLPEPVLRTETRPGMILYHLQPY